MNFVGVASLRNLLHENFRDIVYEWEDDFVRLTNGEMLLVNDRTCSYTERIRRKFNKHNIAGCYDVNNSVYLAFCMYPDEIELYHGINILPVFIDVWPKDINHFVEKVGNNHAIVTSVDMFETLKTRCSNVHYLPLSISDIWKLHTIPKKEKIIVQMGRNNAILHNYAMRYVESGNKVEYIYAEYDVATKKLTYYSTKCGLIKTPMTRKEYMAVLNKALICLLSSPGADNSRPMADGIDYPTPRFYEAAINYCFIIARYGETHKEFKLQGINNLCKNISNYDEFKKLADQYLSGEILNKQKYDDFIEGHLTSVWIKELLNLALVQ